MERRGACVCRRGARAPAERRRCVRVCCGNQPAIREVLPKAGLVYSEKGNLSEVMCKPKLMPLKSITLERLEAMEREAKAATMAAAGSVGGPAFAGASAGAGRG